MRPLDDLDLEILRLLQADALLPYKQIAAQLNLSTTPVFERIKKLERDKVIQQYVALVSKEALGKAFVVLCQVSLKNHEEATYRNFQQQVQQLPEVTECLLISGQHDYQVKVVVAGMEPYQQFLAKLAQTGSVAKTESIFVMKEIKSTTALPIH